MTQRDGREKSLPPKKLGGSISTKVICKKPKPRKVINKTEKELLINNLRAEPKVYGQIIH